MALLQRDEYLTHLRQDAAALADAARRQPDAAVAACPGWGVSQLLAHTGRVHRMARAVVANGLSERPTSEQIGKPPAEASAILPWFEEGAAALLSALQECDPEAPAWNFTGVDTTMGFWVRRQAHETSIHRWDGQSAAGATTPIPSAVAVDGVDELFMLLGSQLPRVRPDAATDGSLHLHATDAEGEWTLRIDHGQVQVQTGHSKGDAAIRGTASDLNLLVWGRRNPLTEGGYELFGDTAVIERYVAIGAF